MIHHRAQLGVYLRLIGIAIQGMYEPSTNEQPATAKLKFTLVALAYGRALSGTPKARA